MKFLKICKKTLIFILKSILIFITGLIASFILLFAVLEISGEIINYNHFGSALIIQVPKRDADFREDTHGGFHGDGDTVEIYELTDKEIEKINEDIKANGVWKLINEEIKAEIYPSDHSFGYFQNKVPQLESGWYCFYNKQTGEYGFPEGMQYSHNYIIGQYSEEERKLWIYELDT